MPQPLTRFGSVRGATPAWSETRSGAKYDVAKTQRFSSGSRNGRRCLLPPKRSERRKGFFVKNDIPANMGGSPFDNGALVATDRAFRGRSLEAESLKGAAEAMPSLGSE